MEQNIKKQNKNADENLFKNINIRIQQNQYNENQQRDNQAIHDKDMQQLEHNQQNTGVYKPQDKYISRLKRYDYLNKYNQHEMLAKIYPVDETITQQQITKRQDRITGFINNRQHDKPISKQKHKQHNNIQQRKNILNIDRRQRNKSKSTSSNNHKSKQQRQKSKIQQEQQQNNRSQKHREKPKHKTKSRQRSLSKQRHFMYLQAYQNNIPIFQDNPYSRQLINLRRTLVADDFNNKQNAQLDRMITRIPNLSNGLASQISHQNQIYRQQINEYRSMVNKLQLELVDANQKIFSMQQLMMNQEACSQQIIKDLKIEVVNLLNYKQRYEILNNQMMVLTNKYENCIQMHNKQNYNSINIYNSGKKQKVIDYANNQVNDKVENLNKTLSLTKGKIRKVQKNSSIDRISNIQKCILHKIQSILSTNQKCISQCDKCPTAVKLSQTLQQAILRIQKIVNANKKYQNFILNIKEMQKKIQKNRQNTYDQNMNKCGDPTIKQLWKWLKFIGSNYSFMQQIKPLLGKRIGLSQQQSNLKDSRLLLQKLLIST